MISPAIRFKPASVRIAEVGAQGVPCLWRRCVAATARRQSQTVQETDPCRPMPIAGFAPVGSQRWKVAAPRQPARSADRSRAGLRPASAIELERGKQTAGDHLRFVCPSRVLSPARSAVATGQRSRERSGVLCVPCALRARSSAASARSLVIVWPIAPSPRPLRCSRWRSPRAAHGIRSRARDIR